MLVFPPVRIASLSLLVALLGVATACEKTKTDEPSPSTTTLAENGSDSADLESHVSALVLAGDGHSLMGISGAAATLNRSFITTDTAQSTYLPFTFPGQVNQSFPTGISRDGSVVSGWDTHTSSSIQVGWRWSASGGMQILPFLALAMSGDGNTVFGHTGGGQHLMWQNGVTTTIPGGGTWISAINDDGSIFAGLSGQGKTIWNHGQPTIVPLLPGRTLGTFTDINEDGTVAVGIDRTGQSGSELK